MQNENTDHEKLKELIALRSLSEDPLMVRSKQANSLIEQGHWYSDNSYNEKLIREAIASSLPERYSVSHGFMAASGAKGSRSSSQLDVFVHDTFDFPPVFRDGDFSVSIPENVSAVIEVKSHIGYNNSELKDACSTLENAFNFKDNRRIPTDSKQLLTAIAAFTLDRFPEDSGDSYTASMIKIAEELIDRYSRRSGKSIYKLNDISFDAAMSLPALLPHLIALISDDVLIYLTKKVINYNYQPYICPVIRFLNTKRDGSKGTQNNSMNILSGAVAFHCNRKENEASISGKREIDLDQYMKLVENSFDETEPPISLIRTDDQKMINVFNSVLFI